jgi:nitrate/nitrite transport system substrate-binding protein
LGGFFVLGRIAGEEDEMQSKGKIMRKTFGLAIALALSTALAGCSGGGGEETKVVAKGGLEKPAVKLGFIKLTDMAPLAIAKEKGFFAEEGLTVTLEPQANWKVLLDGVIGGQLDGAHMLAGQPIAASIGLGVKGDLVAPLSLDLNGNAITLSNKVYDMIAPTLPKGEDGKPTHPISAAALKPVVTKMKAEGKPLKMGMVFPVSPHNYELRYWLAAGGLNPGYYLPGDVAGTTSADVQLSVTPPPQMPATLEAGTIDGYSVGEPWNQAAVQKKIGVPVITDHEIANFNPEKVFGLKKEFVEKNPKTVQALIRAIIKAQMWLDADDGKNRAEAVKILSQPNYVGADEKVIAASMTGQFTFAPGDTRPAPEFNIFFENFAGYPFYSDAIWYLTQMRRWGQIAEAKDDGWYMTTAKSVYRPDLYMAAAKSLVDEGKAPADAFPSDDSGIRKPQGKFIDGISYDATKPNAYLASFSIGLKGEQKVTPAGVK